MENNNEPLKVGDKIKFKATGTSRGNVSGYGTVKEVHSSLVTIEVDGESKYRLIVNKQELLWQQQIKVVEEFTRIIHNIHDMLAIEKIEMTIALKRYDFDRTVFTIQKEIYEHSGMPLHHSGPINFPQPTDADSFILGLENHTITFIRKP